LGTASETELHSLMQTSNHKKREVDLSQQISHDAEPFRVERFSAYGLACATVPVGFVALIAFLAVQVSVPFLASLIRQG
jgi:hypothetical protein